MIDLLIKEKRRLAAAEAAAGLYDRVATDCTVNFGHYHSSLAERLFSIQSCAWRGSARNDDHRNLTALHSIPDGRGKPGELRREAPPAKIRQYPDFVRLFKNV